MVLVDGYDQDEHTEVHTVVLADDPDDIHLVRDDRGQFLVYDQHMERVDDDPAQAAIRAAENREGWPDRDDWEQGPDALRYPFLYETAAGDTPDEDKNLEPLDRTDFPAGSWGFARPSPDER